MRQDWLRACFHTPDHRLFAVAPDARRARFHSWRTVPRYMIWHPSIFNDPTYIVDTIRCEHSPPASAYR